MSRKFLPRDVLEPFQLGPDLCDPQQFSRPQLCQRAVEGTELLILKTAQTCAVLSSSTGLLAQSSRVCVYKWVVQYLGTGNYRHEDNCLTSQFSGRHSLPKEVPRAVLINRETALAVLVSLIDNIRLRLTATRIKCAQKLRTTLFHPIIFWLTKDPPILQNSWGLNLMLVPGDL